MKIATIWTLLFWDFAVCLSLHHPFYGQTENSFNIVKIKMNFQCWTQPGDKILKSHRRFILFHFQSLHELANIFLAPYSVMGWNKSTPDCLLHSWDYIRMKSGNKRPKLKGALNIPVREAFRGKAFSKQWYLGNFKFSSNPCLIVNNICETWKEFCPSVGGVHWVLVKFSVNLTLKGKKAEIETRKRTFFLSVPQ